MSYRERMQYFDYESRACIFLATSIELYYDSNHKFSVFYLSSSGVMKESIFAEFQYFIKRINEFRSGLDLKGGQTIEDLEQRFRVQVERGLVISDPDAQEVAMEILLSDLSEDKKRQHLMELRRTGKTNFEIKRSPLKTISSNRNLSPEQKKERALDLIILALKKVGVIAQKQPLAVKMFMADYELKGINYDDHNDLKLLLVKTTQLSGHAKKANAEMLAKAFNDLLLRL